MLTTPQVHEAKAEDEARAALFLVSVKQTFQQTNSKPQVLYV